MSVCPEIRSELLNSGRGSMESPWERLFDAVSAGNLSMIESLLTKDPALVNETGDVGSTVLHLACNRGREKVVEKLLNFDPDLSLKSISGKTARQCAEQKGFHTIVELIDKKKEAKEKRELKVEMPVEEKKEEEKVAVHDDKGRLEGKVLFHLLKVRQGSDNVRDLDEMVSSWTVEKLKGFLEESGKL